MQKIVCRTAVFLFINLFFKFAVFPLPCLSEWRVRGKACMSQKPETRHFWSSGIRDPCGLEAKRELLWKLFPPSQHSGRSSEVCEGRTPIASFPSLELLKSCLSSACFCSQNS